MPNLRILVFAKAPLPGFAKTRLIPAIGAPAAAKLAQDRLVHNLDQALAAKIGPVELVVTPRPQPPHALPPQWLQTLQKAESKAD